MALNGVCKCTWFSKISVIGCSDNGLWWVGSSADTILVKEPIDDFDGGSLFFSGMVQRYYLVAALMIVRNLMWPLRLFFSVVVAFALLCRTSWRLEGPLTNERSMWKDWPGMVFSLGSRFQPWYFVILLFSQNGHLKKGAEEGSFGMPSTTCCVLCSVEGEMWPYRWCHSSRFFIDVGRPALRAMERLLVVHDLHCGASFYWTFLIVVVRTRCICVR